MSTIRQGAKDALRLVQEQIAAAVEEGDLDQGQAPLLEAFEAYHECNPVSFSMPATRPAARSTSSRGRSSAMGPKRADAPAHKGLDDRVFSYKVQSLAQQLAADAFGADEALFLTNGSTLRVQIAVLAATTGASRSPSLAACTSRSPPS